MEKKSKAEIIKEIANHYNINNRSVNDNQSGYQKCLYVGNNTCCAFSYMVKDENKELLMEYDHLYLEKGYSTSATVILTKHGFDILKEEYCHDWDYIFYVELQSFHDDSSNFTYKGLSYRGEAKKDELIRKYS